MPTKNKIQFDELDLKCLNEMPLILDILSTTGNKITRILSPFYSEVNEYVKNNLKTNWHVNEAKSYSCLIFPFIDTDIKKINIEQFEDVFRIQSTVFIEKKTKGNLINYFWVYFGYICYSSNEGFENEFYFSILKDDLRERIGGSIYPLNFYNKMKSTLIGKEIEILHPQKGDEVELIEIKIKDFSVEKIEDGFNVFKQSILLPFLKSIE